MLPTYSLRTRQEQNQPQVWDFIRKKWVHLSPEEEVRQCLLHYLVKEKSLSPALIAVEREIPYFDLRKRFDVVVFGKNGKPWLICECKAPQVALSQEVLYQIARYNASLQAPHLLITNGPQLLFFSLNENGKYDFQESGWAAKDEGQGDD